MRAMLAGLVCLCVVAVCAVPALAANRVDAVAEALNAVRRFHDLPTVTVDQRLNAIAASHAASMAGQDYFDHVSPEGVGLGDRIRGSGYPFRLALENIAAGRAGAEDTVADWMASAGHRVNMLNPQVTHIGIGHAAVDEGADDRPYRDYWVLVLAAER